MTELLTLKEFCSILKISQETAHDWIRRYRDLPAFKVGRLWRFKKDELLEWIERQKQRSDKNFRPKEIL